MTAERERWTASVQTLLPLEGVLGDALLLKGRRLRAVIEASPVNFFLRPPAEQEALIAAYRAFLHSLSFPLQVVVRSMPASAEGYLAGLAAARSRLDGELRRLALEHEAFVRGLLQDGAHVVLERHVYVVVPGDDGPALPPARRVLGFLRRQPRRERQEEERLERERLRASLRTLEMRVRTVQEGLSACGIATRRLPAHEALAVAASCLGASAAPVLDPLGPLHMAKTSTGGPGSNGARQRQVWR